MIIFFYGADSFRRQQKLQAMQTHFTATVDSGAFSLEKISSQNLKIEEIAKKIGAGSLFAKKRMVIIENLFTQKSDNLFENLLPLLKNQLADNQNVLVFIDQEISEKSLTPAAKKVFKLITNQPYSQEFKLLTTPQTINFAKKTLIERQQAIANNAINLLITKTGNDLWRLNNEINKLQALAHGREISLSDVQEIVTGDFEENIFSLTDAFAEKKGKIAYKIINEQLAAGLSAEYILSMLARQIKILIEIKSALGSQDSNNLSQQLGLHPFVIKKGINQANVFSLEELKSLFNKLIDLEFRVKTGQASLSHELLLLAAETD